ncbi:SEC14 cytosolic factor [Lachnellula suecica]|uniref:SEC14 cytosolic factor n=1 Tax=Lachnellula suecica TaxID=602035 RepID=A0A8T9BVX4_9HELO|nr:SEC14 cytosolic factor [Lachnellula suecica]
MSSTSGPAHRVSSAAVEYGYPQGHLGHLTTEEDTAFKSFKTLCAEKGYYKPGSAEGVASHDDALLLRYLRARRFHVEDAFKQFQDTEDWRKANELDKLYETIDLDHYEETRRLYPQWTGRRDRRGIPVYVFEVKHLNSKTMSAYEKSAVATSSKAQTDGKTSPKLLRLFALYENLTRFVMPLCTALTDRDHPHTPITQSNNIVDISGVGLKQFWNLRTHMQDASTLATAHYPETLDRIFIIGAPSFFPTVWGWIKKWFDPITTSKIFILSHSDMKKTLESFIDPSNIPKKYGGSLDFHFGDMPVLDPRLSNVLKWEGGRVDFPGGPMYWVSDGGKEGEERIKLLAVGSEGGKERRQEVCVVTRHLPEASTSSTNTPSTSKPTTANGHLAPASALSHSQLTAPTEMDLPSTINQPAPSEQEKVAETEQKAPEASEKIPEQEPAQEQAKPEVQAGELVPPTRPEPVSFVTASEGVPQSQLKDLSLNEKDVNANGGGPHQTATANRLDPNLHVGEGKA